VDGLVFCKWWRRRESNPRPKIFHTGFYIHIPDFGFRLLKSPPGRMLGRLTCCISPAVAQVVKVGYPASRRPFRICRRNPEGRWPKRPKRSYNRLRLYLIPPFLRAGGARYATCISLFPSNPFRPHIVKEPGLKPFVTHARLYSQIQTKESSHVFYINSIFYIY